MYSRSQYAQQWARRLDNEKRFAPPDKDSGFAESGHEASKRLPMTGKLVDTGGAKMPRALSLELLSDPSAGFAYGGLNPGTLHAKGRLPETHKVHYSIGVSGSYLMHVRLRKQAASLPGSPFLLAVDPGEAYALSCSLPSTPLMGVCGGRDCTYVLTTGDKLGNRCDKGGAKIVGKTVGKTPDVVRVSVVDHQDGTFTLEWSCTRPGTYQTHITLDGTPVVNSPNTVQFCPAPPVLANSEISGAALPAADAALGHTVAKMPATFVLRFRDRFQNLTKPTAAFQAAFKPGISMINEKDVREGGGASSKAIPNMSHRYEGRWIEGEGAFELTYTPTSTGKMQLIVWFEACCLGEDGQEMGEKVACSGLPCWIQVSRHPDDLVDTDGQGATAPQDYMVDRSIFDDVQKKWGACTVDVFASEATALVPRFWTKTGAPGSPAEALDAFSQVWAAQGPNTPSGMSERLWVHPPPEALAEVADYLKRPDRTAETLVCVPSWCKRPIWEFDSLADGKMKFSRACAPRALALPTLICHQRQP